MRLDNFRNVIILTFNRFLISLIFDVIYFYFVNEE